MKKSWVESFLVLSAITTIQAGVFNNPPEVYAPVWETAYPYQRNITMGYGVTPVGAPGNGIPGAIYEGTLDSSLKVSDYATLANAYWMNSISGVTRTGLVGINNRSGGSFRTGTLSLRIDNALLSNPNKHVWLEFEWYGMWEGTNYVSATVRDPNGGYFANLGGTSWEWLEGGWVRQSIEFSAIPNPAYETIEFMFFASPWAAVLLDNVHIATECVPEPSMLTLAIIGAAIVSCRRSSTIRIGG